MAWTAPVRNYDGIQFEALRKEVDKPFNDFHDELSASYYEGGVFKHVWLKQWGYPKEIDFAAMKAVDAKALFDELHGLQDMKRQEKFHQTNMGKAEKERIPEEKYNLILDEAGVVIGKNSDEIAAKIANVKTQKGFELVVE